MPVERRVSCESAFQFRHLASIPAVTFFILVALQYPIDHDRVYGSPPFLFGLDAAFILIPSIISVFVTVRGYLASGSEVLLYLGCGLLAMGYSSLVAGWVAVDRDGIHDSLNVFHIGCLVVAFLHLKGALSAARVRSPAVAPGGNLRRNVVYAFGMVILGISALAFWDSYDASPEFLTRTIGPGLQEQLVIGLVVSLFIASSFIMTSAYARTRSAYLYWYALALLLMAQGLGPFAFQPAVWTPFSWTGRFYQYAGTLYLLVTASIALRDEPGLSLRSSGVINELAGRKQTEESLLESEERFRLATESLNGLVYEADLGEGTVRRWSGLYELLGYENREVPDRTDWWWRQIHPDDVEGLWSLRSAAFAARRPVASAEYRMRHRNGRWLWVMDNSRIIYGEDGRAIRLVGCTISIDVRKRTQRLLRESEARHRRLFESDIIGIMHADRDRITDANDVFLQVVGYTREDLEAGRLVWHGLTPSEYASRDEDALAELLERGNATPYEKEYFRRDGSRVSILIGASLLSRDPLNWVCFVLDITERKLMDEELRKSRDELELRVRERTAELVNANEALRMSEEEFRLLSSKLLTIQEEERKRIAGELHDTIGQTLAALKYWVEMILHSRDSIDTAEAMDKLKLFVPALQQSIEETRAIYMGLRPTILDNLGVVATIQWLRQQFDKLHPKHHIELALEVAEDEIPERLKIVIFRTVQESLNNVAKHSRAEWVDLSLSKSNGTVALAVADDGVGMDMDAVLARTGARGCLGLTGMRERVELSGGFFSFESAPGEGTTVRASWRTGNG